MTEEFFRPTCINTGCSKPVASSGPRWRPVCGHCHKAGYGAGKFALGVTPFRTGYCSNSIGHLGFVCPINYTNATWCIGHTQIDHIDGNHLNNILENVQELCDICHKEKGKRSGDFKQRRYSYNKKGITSSYTFSS
jgi:hypothetical protein